MLLMGATAGWTSRRLRLLGEPAVRSCSHECSHAAQAWHHCPLLASMPAASRPHCHELFACKVLMALLLCVPGPAGLQAALRLYRGSGFAQHGEELPPAEEGQGGWLGTPGSGALAQAVCCTASQHVLRDDGHALPGCLCSLPSCPCCPQADGCCCAWCWSRGSDLQLCSARRECEQPRLTLPILL